LTTGYWEAAHIRAFARTCKGQGRLDREAPLKAKTPRRKSKEDDLAPAGRRERFSIPTPTAWEQHKEDLFLSRGKRR